MITADRPHDLRDYFNRIFRPKKLLGKSARTVAIYLATFDRFAEYLQRNPTLDDLTDEALCGFLEWRLSAGRAFHTCDKESDKLVALANYAARKRHIAEFVDIPKLQPPEQLPTCWTREQLATLLAACAQAKGHFGLAPRSLWWVAFHFLCLATGERTEAMLSLRWEMLTGDVLSVPASIRKGRRKAARYRLPMAVVNAVERLRPYTQGRIFAAPWKDLRASFYYHYGQLLRAAGLPKGRDFKPQRLRKSFASYLEAAGGDATKALGHVDRRVTRDSYLDTGVTEAGMESASVVVWRELGMQ
jgi:integrase